MGGLSRKYTAVNKLISRGIDPIILDAGDLLFSKPNVDSSNSKSKIFRASAMINGFEKIGCDVVNVGHYEFASGYEQLKELINNTSIPFISANLLDPETEDPIFKPYRIIDRGGITFGVIGLTDLVSDTLESVMVQDFAMTGNLYLDAIKDKVDMTILLVNSERSTYKELPKIFPSADFIFTSGSTFMTRPMMDQEDNGPFIFSSGREGRYLNQVDITLLDDSGQIINRSFYEARIAYTKKRIDRYRDKDPTVPLETLYADQPNILSSIKLARQEMKRMKVLLEERANSIIFQNLPMDSTIIDHPEILNYVNRSLEKCDQLLAE